jgi:hypothetical protein
MSLLERGPSFWAGGARNGLRMVVVSWLLTVWSGFCPHGPHVSTWSPGPACGKAGCPKQWGPIDTTNRRVPVGLSQLTRNENRMIFGAPSPYRL